MWSGSAGSTSMSGSLLREISSQSRLTLGAPSASTEHSVSDTPPGFAAHREGRALRRHPARPGGRLANRRKEQYQDHAREEPRRAASSDLLSQVTTRARSGPSHRSLTHGSTRTQACRLCQPSDARDRKPPFLQRSCIVSRWAFQDAGLLRSCVATRSDGGNRVSSIDTTAGAKRWSEAPPSLCDQVCPLNQMSPGPLHDGAAPHAATASPAPITSIPR